MRSNFFDISNDYYNFEFYKINPEPYDYCLITCSTAVKDCFLKQFLHD